MHGFPLPHQGSFPSAFCATISEEEQLFLRRNNLARRSRSTGITAGWMEELEGERSTPRDSVPPAASLSSYRSPGNVAQSLLPPAFWLLSSTTTSHSPAWKSRGDAAPPSRTQLREKVLPSPLCSASQQEPRFEQCFPRKKPLLSFPCGFPTAGNVSVPLPSSCSVPGSTTPTWKCVSRIHLNE